MAAGKWSGSDGGPAPPGGEPDRPHHHYPAVTQPLNAVSLDPPAVTA